MLIMRAEALRAQRVYFDDKGHSFMAVPVEAIRAIPSAENRGKWVFDGRDDHGKPMYRCACVHRQRYGGNFCSECGRRNRKEGDLR